MHTYKDKFDLLQLQNDALNLARYCNDAIMTERLDCDPVPDMLRIREKIQHLKLYLEKL